jgi:arsenite-transporting ATPase
MVIQEAKRAFTYLNLYGYNVDAVVVNRILPRMAGGEGSVFEQYVQSQGKYLADIDESFQPLPIFKVYHQGKEVFGLQLLSSIAQSIYEDRNPAEIFHNESPFQVEEFPLYYKISMFLPFIQEEDFKVEKFGDELLIILAGRKKSVLLPRFANFLQLDGYAFEQPWLRIKLLKEK